MVPGLESSLRVRSEYRSAISVQIAGWSWWKCPAGGMISIRMTLCAVGLFLSDCGCCYRRYLGPRGTGARPCHVFVGTSSGTCRGAAVWRFCRRKNNMEMGGKPPQYYTTWMHNIFSVLVNHIINHCDSSFRRLLSS